LKNDGHVVLTTAQTCCAHVFEQYRLRSNPPSGSRDLVIQRKEKHRKTNQQGFNYSKKIKKEMTSK
jgi:hypothetical protein